MPSHRHRLSGARIEIAVLASTLALAVSCDDAGGAAAPSREADPALVAGEPPRPPSDDAERDAKPVPSEPRAGEGVLALGGVPPKLETVAGDATVGCEICRFESGPKLVVLGALDDPSWHTALQDLDAIGSFYADDGLGTFAVLGERAQDGVRATGDPSAVRARADELRTKLRLAVPLSLAARGELGFDDYRVAKSPTVLLLDGKGAVLWTGIAMKRWGELDAAITRALARPE